MQETSSRLVRRSIGHYRLIRVIGVGGMGTVYQAHGRNGAVVALKVLHPHLASDPSSRSRFEREGDIAQLLRSPNIVRVWGLGSALV
jgi:serine/threonine protein kinase